MNIIIPIGASLSIITSLLLFIINPGIIYSDNKSKNNKNEQKIYCGACKFLYPNSNKKMEHCYTCNICVCNYDHHCGVVGKCVGKYNIILFPAFALCNFGLIFCIYLLLFNCLFISSEGH